MIFVGSRLTGGFDDLIVNRIDIFQDLLLEGVIEELGIFGEL